MLYTTASELPSATYDYVIIGAGAAGSVVANRLTENPNITVLLLEAGISNEGIVAAQIPLFGPTLAPNTPYDWNFSTTPQTGYHGRAIPYPRGKMLGGTTSINYMVYTRGSKEDWDQYAAITGDDGWSWDKIHPYILKNEKFTLPKPELNIATEGMYRPSEHSTSGILPVSLPTDPVTLDDFVIKTTKEQSLEFPFNSDMASGDVLGVGWTYTAIGNGVRSSSATAYLGPEFMKRSNLHVLINAQATKLVQTGTQGGLPSFHKVEFSSATPGASTNIVTATREIIISAGSVSTPQLLQLSGIGRPSDLSPLGIKSIVSLPDVGYRLSDRPLLSTQFYIKDESSYDGLFRNPDLLKEKMDEWTEKKTGPLANTITNHLGWLRIPADLPIFKTEADPASGPNSSHWEIIFTNTYADPGKVPPPTGNFITVFIGLAAPTSRGSIVINSDSPFTQPSINPNFLDTKMDITVMKEALKVVRRLMASSTWETFIDKPFGELDQLGESEEALEAYVRKNSGSEWHPVGTASMSPWDSETGVVNPDLTVKKTVGLRVVDASVLPFVPNAHPQVPIYVAAERASDLIKESQSKPVEKEAPLV